MDSWHEENLPATSEMTLELGNSWKQATSKTDLAKQFVTFDFDTIWKQTSSESIGVVAFWIYLLADGILTMSHLNYVGGIWKLSIYRTYLRRRLSDSKSWHDASETLACLWRFCGTIRMATDPTTPDWGQRLKLWLISKWNSETVMPPNAAFETDIFVIACLFP